MKLAIKNYGHAWRRLLYMYCLQHHILCTISKNNITVYVQSSYLFSFCSVAIGICLLFNIVLLCFPKLFWENPLRNFHRNYRITSLYLAIQLELCQLFKQSLFKNQTSQMTTFLGDTVYFL